MAKIEKSKLSFRENSRKIGERDSVMVGREGRMYIENSLIETWALTVTFIAVMLFDEIE
jgi:hypothetical protein